MRPPACGHPMAERRAAQVQAALERVLPAGDDVLAEAMRYAVLGGGKRIRPRLVYAAGSVAGAETRHLDQAAAAVELLHCYSLVHDDLPAMDDDDLRRGRPSVHVRFGEATAILAGDALQALAFEAVAHEDLPPTVAANWTRLLAKAAGFRGMVGGQMLDLAGEQRALAHSELEAMHRRKTGALLHAAVLMGAVGGNASAAEVEALSRFGAEIGLAFQIRDDVLDATAETTVLGKPQGSDARQGKSTYVSVFGLDAARTEAERRLRNAGDALATIGDRAEDLREIARFAVLRES